MIFMKITKILICSGDHDKNSVTANKIYSIKSVFLDIFYNDRQSVIFRCLDRIVVSVTSFGKKRYILAV